MYKQCFKVAAAPSPTSYIHWLQLGGTCRGPAGKIRLRQSLITQLDADALDSGGRKTEN